ncbi:hypothetical protein DXB69_16320 [Agathobacter rectalis]|uniref:Uncharacterized protein n=1 Tax=Agathobacter rectalis TaxID=39491 RepID=A0A3E5AJ41_9FIRM|nr:hypothetical protein DXB76_16285 [Agathobacter rectalis]RGN19052.1 hypothetical protein DXB69_16320 [Agathobacter rectalis]RGN19412.1 hypothetical protein DXB72_15400 [Agathobacter rectalis]
MQRATYAHIKVESYQRQNPAQPGLLPLTAYTKLLRVCRIAYEKNNNAHAWTHGRGVMRHGRRIKAGCVKKPQPAYAIRTDT